MAHRRIFTILAYIPIVFGFLATSSYAQDSYAFSELYDYYPLTTEKLSSSAIVEPTDSGKTVIDTLSEFYDNFSIKNTAPPIYESVFGSSEERSFYSENTSSYQTAQILPQGLVPCGRQADDPSTPEMENADCTLCHFFVLTDRIMDWVIIAMAPILAVLSIVFGGFLILTSRGNPSQYQQGKGFIVWPLAGIALIMISWVLVNTFLMFFNITSWTGLGNWWSVQCEVAGVGTIGGSPPSVTMIADNSTIDKGDDITLTWVVSNANSCVIQSVPNDPSWNTGDPRSSSGGFQTFEPPSSGTYAYSIECNNGVGFSSDNVQIMVNAPVGTPPPIVPSPVAHWRFDESSGTVLSESINGINGQLLSGPIWVPGRIGNALRFDGSDDYVNIPYNPLLQTADEMTISVWINPSVIPLPIAPDAPDWSILARAGAIGTAEENYSLTLRGPGVRWRPCFDTDGDGAGDNCAEVWASNGISAGTWTHIAAVYKKGSFSRMYFNGAPVGGGPSASPNFTLVSTSLGLNIGLSTWLWAYYFNGMIDDIKLWNVALTQAQIQEEFNSAP